MGDGSYAMIRSPRMEMVESTLKLHLLPDGVEEAEYVIVMDSSNVSESRDLARSRRKGRH